VARIELRTFDGDLDALAAMANETLHAENGETDWRDMNQPEAIRLTLADVPDPRFLIGAYDGSRLVAFVANLPRRYGWNGQTYRGVYATMLAARLGYQGAAAMLMGECLRRNREYQADLALFTVQAGIRAERLFSLFEGRGQRVERLRGMHAVARPVDLRAVVESQHVPGYVRLAAQWVGVGRPIRVAGGDARLGVRPYQTADLDAVLALTQRYAEQRNLLVRAFSREALAHRLATAGVTETLVCERQGAVRGYINWSVCELASARSRRRWAWLDLVYWAKLSAAEQRALLAALWQRSRAQGCIGILEWTRGYYDMGALYRARFVPYTNRIAAYAWVLNPALSFRGIRGVMDEIA
jgi:hypothetical protein